MIYISSGRALSTFSGVISKTPITGIVPFSIFSATAFHFSTYGPSCINLAAPVTLYPLSVRFYGIIITVLFQNQNILTNLLLTNKFVIDKFSIEFNNNY